MRKTIENQSLGAATCLLAGIVAACGSPMTQQDSDAATGSADAEAGAPDTAPPLDAALPINTWTALPTADAPSGRTHHTAIWTGTEMIVWGGGFPSLSTGARYRPDTDAWTAVPDQGAPSTRASHTAVWSGTEMIIWGGSGTGGYQATGGRY
ncbi:MAG: hypothetical protein H6Q90_6369, partial [Deltaproteobacteria bacterium]|nr:hypothetical protein [Deltaproteobacteria bacterium]